MWLLFWQQLEESSDLLHELGLKVEMRCSPVNCIAWKVGKRHAATRDAEIISTTLCATCLLFSLCIFSKTNPNIPKYCLLESPERCRLHLHSVSPFICLNRKKDKKKEKSRFKFSKWKSYHFPLHILLHFIGKHMRVLFSLCSQILFFSSPTQILDTAHI